MHSNRTFILLCFALLVGAGFVVARFVSPEPIAPKERSPKAGPTATNHVTDRPSTVRSASGLHLNPKENIKPELSATDLVKDLSPQQALESKFQNWRAEGKKLIEEMAGGDREKIGAAFRSAFQNQAFKDLYTRNHELETKWKDASDTEKEGIMAELSAIREKGFSFIKAEMNKASTPASGENTAGVVTITPATASPAAAPAAPAAPAAVPAQPPFIQ
ncbi:MAG: hypothetical protein EBS64_10430 [Verrucomicrobia bacterium]|nr:hypothetical protein [Verrucomicrobiota bacterium]